MSTTGSGSGASSLRNSMRTGAKPPRLARETWRVNVQPAGDVNPSESGLVGDLNDAPSIQMLT